HTFATSKAVPPHLCHLCRSQSTLASQSQAQALALPLPKVTPHPCRRPQRLHRHHRRGGSVAAPSGDASPPPLHHRCTSHDSPFLLQSALPPLPWEYPMSLH